MNILHAFACQCVVTVGNALKFVVMNSIGMQIANSEIFNIAVTSISFIVDTLYTTAS